MSCVVLFLPPGHFLCLSHCSANVPALSLSPPATKEELQKLLPKLQQHLPLEMAQEPAVPCSKCGWFHRRTLEEVQAGREAARAAKQRPRKRKQTYAVRREDVRYRFSMFKAQATRRGKEVELLRHDYARILRQPCLYCGSTERRRPRAERRALHARQLGAVLCDV